MLEETSSKAMVAIDGAGFDWSYMADDEVPTNMALMAFSDSEVHNDKTCSKTCLKSFETLKTQVDDLRIEFNKSEFNLATYKRGLASVKEELVFYKKNELEKLKQEKESNKLKIEKFENASKSLDKLIKSQITNKSRKGMGFVSYNAVSPPPTWLFLPLKFDLSNSGPEEFQQPEFEGYRPKTSKSVSKDISNEVRETPDASMVKELEVLPTKRDNGYVTGDGAMGLTSDFKLADESQVLLKVPRKNNMYSVDMKNIVPKESLTCLVTKATLDESMLWHRRLGIKREYSVARTPQQNGVAEKRNKTLIEATRTMLQVDGKSDEDSLFVEDKAIIAGAGPKVVFDIDVLTKSMNYVPVIAGTNSNDSVGTEESIDTVTIDPLETTHADFFGDETEIYMSSITTTYLVPSTPNTRIYKDHSLDHVIGDVQSGVLTRRMTKTTNEQGFISAVYEGKTHDKLHTCLFSCFLSQDEPKKVYKVEKAIRGSPSSLLEPWYETISTYGLDIGFEDETVSTPMETSKLLLKDAEAKDVDVHLYRSMIGLLMYLTSSRPDIMFAVCRAYWAKMSEVASKRQSMLGSFTYAFCLKTLMHKKFQMSSMGDLTFFLGLQVTQKDDGIFISQDKYMDEILKKFGFSTVKTASTPMETSKPLLKDAEAEDVDVHLYRSMIGSLMYLTSSRPDIMFVVCACARFQVTPKVSHLHAVKRIFRYLKGQPKLGLWYPKDSPFDLEAYSDSDYAGASLDRKSTTGGCQFLGSRLISWQCKKQTIVANSTTEAEYVAAASCCGQVLWIQNQMLDYGYNFMNTKIFIDNESTICIVKNPAFHSKTKHIEIRHHFIRDSNEKKLI
ncbi:putative ribonuclease H-like domain-containing protein [Tanacetum coccineum]